MTLLSAMALGADCIEDCDVLRSGQTSAVLGHRSRRRRRWGRSCEGSRLGMSASSTGCSLRAFTGLGSGCWPGRGTLVVDVDCFVGEVYGCGKQGASFGYTHKRGYHPIVATRAQTGEVLHIRARKGSANTSRGALDSSRNSSLACSGGRERAEAVARRLRVLEVQADGPPASSRLGLLDRGPPTPARQGRDRRDSRARLAALAGLPRGWSGADRADDARPSALDRSSYPADRPAGRAVARLAPFAFLTNRTDAIELVEAEHRQHAVVELASVTSKTKHWRTSRPANSSPTRPGR